MQNIKTKEEILKMKLGSVYESVFKQGDVYKVKAIFDIPKSLINAFVSKSKKEKNVDPRENWSDTDIAEMLVKFITDTYLNIDSIPVSAVLGDSDQTKGEVQTQVQPNEPAQPEMQMQPETQTVQEPVTQAQPSSATNVQGSVEIQ
jgi:hypothetical protein